MISVNATGPAKADRMWPLKTATITQTAANPLAPHRHDLGRRAYSPRNIFNPPGTNGLNSSLTPICRIVDRCHHFVKGPSCGHGLR